MYISVVTQQSRAGRVNIYATFFLRTLESYRDALKKMQRAIVNSIDSSKLTRVTFNVIGEPYYENLFFFFQESESEEGPAECRFLIYVCKFPTESSLARLASIHEFKNLISLLPRIMDFLCSFSARGCVQNARKQNVGRRTQRSDTKLIEKSIFSLRVCIATCAAMYLEVLKTYRMRDMYWI